MADKPLLAHSARPKKNISAQTYFEHVTNVTQKAVSNARNAAAFYNGDRKEFVSWVECAAVYHDLGKLDSANQAVLRQGSTNPLPIAHEDAGVAELDKLKRQESVTLAFGHHAGLFSLRDDVLQTQGRPFRNLAKRTPDDIAVADHVDCELAGYEQKHVSTGSPTLGSTTANKLHACGFTRRIALSCLVDADHGDTAHHYSQEVDARAIEARWEGRLKALNSYVNKLPKGNTESEKQRNNLRKKVFEQCFNSPLGPSICTCDAPVGSGKTTAVMAYLFRVAAARKLRHIIVVLPYTNIITQSVEVYRKALVLEGERPEDIVAEHHHRADYDDIDLRHMATLWKSPIIVTTAVQFFETLGSHHPAQLRKLHELPGSAVFVDEMHASIPSHLWPQVWRWLETFTANWGGHLVLASGSLPRFWKLDEYKNLIHDGANKRILEVPDLVIDKKLREELKDTEIKRVYYQRRNDDAVALDKNKLIEFIHEKKPGPYLLIVNTVQTAAVVANEIRKAGHDVLHLSTALAPVHRGLIIERVKQRLKDKIENWTLVATSCIEAGMDFSFRTGFRERASATSLLQIAGRVNRNGEFNSSSVWDILLSDVSFKDNPTLIVSQRALNNFEITELNNMRTTELVTCAMRREWTSGADEKAKKLIKDEENMEYPDVSNGCRVIEADTRTVIIDRSLANSIRNGDKVSQVELMKYSVQIWANKIKKLALETVTNNECSSDFGFYVWKYDYDPEFLGYMAGVLKLDEFIVEGGAVI